MCEPKKRRKSASEMRTVRPNRWTWSRAQGDAAYGPLADIETLCRGGRRKERGALPVPIAEGVRYARLPAPG